MQKNKSINKGKSLSARQRWALGSFKMKKVFCLDFSAMPGLGRPKDGWFAEHQV
jgi:hypothetical protein